MSEEYVSCLDYIRRSECIWETQAGGQRISSGIKCFRCKTFVKDEDITTHYEECIRKLGEGRGMSDSTLHHETNKRLLKILLRFQDLPYPNMITHGYEKDFEWRVDKMTNEEVSADLTKIEKIRGRVADEPEKEKVNDSIPLRKDLLDFIDWLTQKKYIKEFVGYDKIDEFLRSEKRSEEDKTIDAITVFAEKYFHFKLLEFHKVELRRMIRSGSNKISGKKVDLIVQDKLGEIQDDEEETEEVDLAEIGMQQAAEEEGWGDR